MQPTYHPSLSQVPFSFMLPNVSGNGQHKIGHQIFPQQNVDETMVDQRLPAQQQKVILLYNFCFKCGQIFYKVFSFFSIDISN